MGKSEFNNMVSGGRLNICSLILPFIMGIVLGITAKFADGGTSCTISLYLPI